MGRNQGIIIGLTLAAKAATPALGGNVRSWQVDSGNWSASGDWPGAAAPVLADGAELVFFRMTGGREGADIDSLDVPPQDNQTVIILVDLEPLDRVPGRETIDRLFVSDTGGPGDSRVIEGFALCVGVTGACGQPEGECLPQTKKDRDAGGAGSSWRRDGPRPD